MAIQENSVGTVYTFGTSARTKFVEVGVTPPGLEGGEPNNLTNHTNSTVKTYGPKVLIDVTPMQSLVNWDVAAYDEILAAINVNQLITITFPDGSTLAFWGYLRSFMPSDYNAESDDDPTATITIQPTNRNGSKVETLPDYTAP